jgi:TPR repeat protein
MYEMGQKYENGKGVARNTQTAIMWYRRAASKQIEQSDPATAEMARESLKRLGAPLQ